MEQLFKYINPNENDSLSCLTSNNLQNLLILLDDYQLILRNKLNFDSKITFGLEIEFEKVDMYKVSKELEKLFAKKGWETTSDLSLGKGLEIKSPILKDNIKTWQDVNVVCETVNQYGVIDRKSGAHVHVGSQILNRNPKTWLNFLKIWSVYENIIYRFAYGRFLTARPRILEYAKPMSRAFWNNYEFLRDSNAIVELIIKNISAVKHQAVSFKKVRYSYSDIFSRDNTIEFRCPNGTLDPIIWQNNVNLFVKMLQACNTFNSDGIVDKRNEIIRGKYDELRWYDEIFVDQALEFCDLIFTNNLDKIYFLKQYLKSFQVCEKRDDYPGEKTITKKMF